MIIAKRDLLNVSNLLKENLGILKKKETEEGGIRKDQALKELEEDINKIDTYIKKEVEDIRK